MQIDGPGRDSERGPAEQFTGSVWTEIPSASQGRLASAGAVMAKPRAPDQGFRRARGTARGATLIGSNINSWRSS